MRLKGLVTFVAAISLVVGAGWLLPTGATESPARGIRQTVNAAVRLAVPALGPVGFTFCVDRNGNGVYDPDECVRVGSDPGGRTHGAGVDLTYELASGTDLPNIATLAGTVADCAGKHGLEMRVGPTRFRSYSFGEITLKDENGARIDGIRLGGAAQPPDVQTIAARLCFV